MSSIHWFIFLACWMLAGVGWCVAFAVMGLKYEPCFEEPGLPEEASDPIDQDIASAA